MALLPHARTPYPLHDGLALYAAWDLHHYSRAKYAKEEPVFTTHDFNNCLGRGHLFFGRP